MTVGDVNNPPVIARRQCNARGRQGRRKAAILTHGRAARDDDRPRHWPHRVDPVTRPLTAGDPDAGDLLACELHGPEALASTSGLGAAEILWSPRTLRSGRRLRAHRGRSDRAPIEPSLLRRRRRHRDKSWRSVGDDLDVEGLSVEVFVGVAGPKSDRVNAPLLGPGNPGHQPARLVDHHADRSLVER